MITEKQLAKHNDNIGGSDIPALFGLDPWKSPYDLWLLKTGKVEAEDGTAITESGNHLEPALLSFAEAKLGKITRRNLERRVQGTPILVHPDAILLEKHEPIEAKKTCRWSDEFWGDAGTDQVPDRVILQAHAQMMALDAVTCHVPHFNGVLFVLYAVPFEIRIADAITERACKFWEANVQADIPPADCLPSLDIVKRVRRTPNKIVTLGAETYTKWAAARQKASEARAASEAAEACLLAEMGDAEGAEFGEPGKLLTYYETKRKGYTVGETTYRTLRVKKQEQE